MKIVVNHLTRMQSGYFCAAGVDVQTKTHVRPMPAQGHLRGDLLAHSGGPFDMGMIMELGPTTPQPDRPHVEDHTFDLANVKAQGILAGSRFWNMVTQMAKPKLKAVFGDDLKMRGKSCQFSLIWIWLDFIS